RKSYNQTCDGFAGRIQQNLLEVLRERPMNYRQVGNSGVRVSVIGLGANRFGSENVPQTEVNRIITAALDLGINFIDTSNNYTAGHSEETLGHALKGRGDKVVLATKFSFPKKDEIGRAQV